MPDKKEIFDKTEELYKKFKKKIQDNGIDLCDKINSAYDFDEWCTSVLTFTRYGFLPREIENEFYPDYAEKWDEVKEYIEENDWT